MTTGSLTGVGRLRRVVAAYLPPGADLVEGIEEAARREGLTSGIVLGGAASLRRVTLRNCRRFKATLDLDDDYLVYWTTDGPYEMVGLTGNIATGSDGALSVHLHAIVSSGQPAGETYGGHLLAAEIYSLGEVALAEAGDLKLERRVDPANQVLHLFSQSDWKEHEGGGKAPPP